MLEKIGTWPAGFVILFIMIGPWIFAFIMSRIQEKRFESVVRMYEHNVSLVKDYEALAKSLQDVVIMNTQAVTQLCRDIESNQFCPIIRKEQRP